VIMVPPVVPYRGTRSLDAFGGGGYGAPRSKACPACTPPTRAACQKCEGKGKLKYAHLGLDFISKPGDLCVFPIDGVVVRDGVAYDKPGCTLGSIHIEGTEGFRGYRVKLLYAALLDALNIGSLGHSGAPLAHAQDVAAYHRAAGKMTNHIHLEVWQDGKRLDPTPFFIKS